MKRAGAMQRVAAEIADGIPEDAALPALATLRSVGLAVIPNLGLNGGKAGVELVLRGYSPANRATFEARLPNRSGWRVALKAYATDPAPEAELYRALGDAVRASGWHARVPRLLGWEPELKLLVIEWLEGPTANELAKDGQPWRAGELAAQWLRVAASLPVRLGPPVGAATVMEEMGQFVAMLDDGEAGLGAVGRALTETLAQNTPTEPTPHLVHRTLYTRHLIDTGPDSGPGVIDWQRFGQGPLELDAGTFLATVSRPALLREKRARAASEVEAAFLAGTSGLLDERAVAWHRAAALLRLAGRMLRRRPPAKAQRLLTEAARLLEIVR